METKSDKAISSENLSKKSTESTPLKLRNEKSNEKDFNCSRENEINKDFFNGLKQEECGVDDIEFVPHFQRVYISGDDNSGVIIEHLLAILFLYLMMNLISYNFNNFSYLSFFLSVN